MFYEQLFFMKLIRKIIFIKKETFLPQKKKLETNPNRTQLPALTFLFATAFLFLPRIFFFSLFLLGRKKIPIGQRKATRVDFFVGTIKTSFPKQEFYIYKLEKIIISYKNLNSFLF